MKGRQFETQAEIYKALLDGKTISHYSHGKYIKLVNGVLSNPINQPVNYSFFRPQDFELVPEVKELKVYAVVNKQTGIIGPLYFHENMANNNIDSYCNCKVIELTGKVELD